MVADIPFVSVVVPCRNEEQYISRCLDSIVANDYPRGRLEVFVIDGMSEDGTREIVQRFSQRYPFVRLLDNPRKIKSSALNVGIAHARGDIIMAMDAHATYDSDYIPKCVRFLNESGADNVGGAMVTEPSDDTLVARSIAISLSHPFGAGNSYFRIGSSAPRWVDTVFGGCYRREVFQKVGLFDEKLVRSMDMNFNLRLARAGGKILLVPELVCHYYPTSTLSSFFRHNLSDGVWLIHPMKLGSGWFRLRHFVPLAFVSSLLVSGALAPFSRQSLWVLLVISASYICATAYFSVKIALRHRDMKYLISMPVVFAARHIGYGLGSIWGLLNRKG